MSAEALAEIQKILENHRISAKLTTWYQDGGTFTKIILKGSAVSAGSQSKTPLGCPAKTKKKHKSASRLRRDFKRRRDHAAKVTGSCDKDHGAAVQEPVPPTTPLTDQSTPRRFPKPGGRLGTSTERGERGTGWGPVSYTHLTLPTKRIV